MAEYRKYPLKFDRIRNLAWNRHKAQCNFRSEAFDLSFQDWCDFWVTEELWDRRGRRIDDLVLTRQDWEQPWSRDNCAIITRDTHLKLKVAVYWGKTTDEFFVNAIKI